MSRCPETVFPDGTGQCALDEGHAGRHTFDASGASPRAAEPPPGEPHAEAELCDWIAQRAKSLPDAAVASGLLEAFRAEVVRASRPASAPAGTPGPSAALTDAVHAARRFGTEIVVGLADAERLLAIVRAAQEAVGTWRGFGLDVAVEPKLRALREALRASGAPAGSAPEPSEAAAPPSADGPGDPVGYLWQHEETGATMLTFDPTNEARRYFMVGPVYLARLRRSSADAATRGEPEGSET